MKKTSCSILFVCLGNIIRSPAAEAILKTFQRDGPLPFDLVIESRGTAFNMAGKSRDSRMVEAAKKRGYLIEGKSKPIEANDFFFFDQIFAADKKILSQLEELAPGQLEREKLSLMTAFSSQYPQFDVPDPYYDGPLGFENVLDILEESCSSVLDHLAKRHG